MKGEFRSGSQYTADDNTNSDLESEDEMEFGTALLTDVAKGFESGDLDVYAMAERIAGLLGEWSGEETSSTNTSPTWSLSEEEEDEEDETDLLMLAGYTDCMHETIRYLLEDENLPSSHPLVQSLSGHLLAHQRTLEQQLVTSCTNGDRLPSI